MSADPRPRRPRLPSQLEERAPTDEELEQGGRVEGLRLVEPQLAGVELSGVDLRDLHVVGGDLSEARLDGGGFMDARLERTNLANLRALSASLHRVELHGCRMTGLQWAEGLWRDVLVTDCRADLCALRYTRLEDVTFRDCLLTEADLVEARLRAVRLERCSLVGADLRGTRFERCELRGCKLDGLRGVERLSGVAMPWPDVVQAAGTFAAALGVTVLDEE